MEDNYPQPTQDYNVIIRCMTYNHEKYIEDALKGFVMQKTDFPFCALVVDDCSTDRTADIIRKYEKEYPDIIKGFYLKENYHSQKKNKNPILQPWMDRCKYVALCEGDDYWTYPYKLQKQVDFLDSHPNCCMVCNRTMLYSLIKSSFVSENRCKKKSAYLNTKDIIRKGGQYISTCSIIYRNNILSTNPDYRRNCHVGDYPLQIFSSLVGDIYYFDEAMSVYRIDNPMSWDGKNNLQSRINEKKLKGMETEINMLKSYANENKSLFKYFYQRINYYVLKNIPDRKELNNPENLIYRNFFADVFNNFSLFWRLYYKCIYGKSIVHRIIRYYISSKFERRIYRL